MALEPLAARLEKELDKEYVDIIVNVVEGEVLKETSQLERLPESMVLAKDGTVQFKSGRGRTEFASIDRLYYLIDTIIQTSARQDKKGWLTEDSDGKKKVPFRRYSIEETMQVPYIMFRVERALPGVFGKGKEYAPSHRQRKKILRHTIEDPEYPNSEIFIFSQGYDNWIQIEVGASTAKEADQIRSWVETTLLDNVWYLKYSGIKEFLFSERLADTIKKVDGKAVHCRTLKYFVQTEMLTWYRLQTLKELCLTLEIGN